VTYSVDFSKVARKQFKKLPSDVQERIQNKINELAIEPRPNGVKKLQGEENSYRIRVGDYQVVYDIFDDVLLINVIRVKHRNQVYRDKS
jgi:mRNA interferase RelE/StbE